MEILFLPDLSSGKRVLPVKMAIVFASVLDQKWISKTYHLYGN